MTDVTPLGGIGIALPLPTDGDAGTIGIPPMLGAVSTAGHHIAVAYDSASMGSRVEYHTVQGWSQEQRVNVDSVYSEGPLVVEREWYASSMTDSLGNAGTEFLSRYWLFWTGLGTVYDMRLINAAVPGTTPDVPSRAGGDPAIYQSADVYTAVVSPHVGPVLRERPMSSVPFDPS